MKQSKYMATIVVIFVLAIAIAFFVSTDLRAQTPKAQLPKVRVKLQQEWFPFSGFAGEVVAAKRFAKDEGLDLQVIAGSEQVDPIKLVLSGSADFGVVGGDLLVSALAKKAPLVAIGVVNPRTPTCFLVQSKSGIKTPKDFMGHRVGILVGTNTERVYELMMKRAGIDRKTIKEVQIPFDLQTFILGQYDVRPAFIYDETVSLEKQHISYEVIDPSLYNVDFLGTVYFTRRDVVQKKRSIVERLVRTLLRGWEYALANPDVAIQDLIAQYPTLEAERERRSFELGKPYFVEQGGRPLNATKDTWKKTIAGLEEIGAIPPNTVTVDQVWDDSFVRGAYGSVPK